MTGLYESGEYLARNPGWHVEEATWKVAQIRKMLRRHDLRPATVCDVGCGVGEVLAQLQRDLDGDCELWGYDISPQAIELCRDRANARLHFQQADPLQSREREHFDLVLLLDVIEHVEDCFGFLRRLRGMGGHALLHVPLDLSAQSVLRRRGLMHMREEYGHVHYFTRETALSTIRETGHTVVDSFYTARAVEQPTGLLLRRLMRWPRRLLFRIRPDLAARLLGGFSLLVLVVSS